MHLSWGLALGAALSAQAGWLAARQNNGSSSTNPLTTSVPENTSSSSISTPTSATLTGGDTTTVVTRTVTLPNVGSTITSTTTVSLSTLITVTVTTTDIATTTVTSRDNDTATKTVYVTSTETVNAKRGVEDDLVRAGDRPAQVGVQSSQSPAITGREAGHYGPESLVQNNDNIRRALLTDFVTMTASGGGQASVVVVTATRAVRSTTTTVIHTTSLITETEQANARTTITTTATIILKLTRLSMGAVETLTSVPTGDPGNGNKNGNKNGSGSSNDGDGGLSNGAKAGIGAGVGAAVLVTVGILSFCYVKRRRSGPKPDPDDLLGPSSEVPVGGGRNSWPMAARLSSAPGAVPRRSPLLPNVQPEGYRGTAMGDGRAGYAKPDSYGPTRNATVNTRNSARSRGDQLPRHPTPDANSALVSPVSARPDTAELGNDGAGAKWHQTGAAEMAVDNPAAVKWRNDNAQEIDGYPVPSERIGKGPVYEMPTERYHR